MRRIRFDYRAWEGILTRRERQNFGKRKKGERKDVKDVKEVKLKERKGEREQMKDENEVKDCTYILIGQKF